MAPRRVFVIIKNTTITQKQRLCQVTSRYMFCTKKTFCIKIWDLHTSQVVTTVTDVEDYQLVAAQTKESQSILIDLLCTTEDYKCSRKGNTFLISYYGKCMKLNKSTTTVTCLFLQTYQHVQKC